PLKRRQPTLQCALLLFRPLGAPCLQPSFHFTNGPLALSVLFLHLGSTSTETRNVLFEHFGPDRVDTALKLGNLVFERRRPGAFFVKLTQRILFCLFVVGAIG